MSTAQLLEAMTDEGEFELLATAILAKSNEAYSTIIHSGVNAEGTTMPYTIDGFFRVLDSGPPRFVYIQHTTTPELRRKWLGSNRNDLGNLIKAVQEAERLRCKFRSAVFTVVLSTNQRSQ